MKLWTKRSKPHWSEMKQDYPEFLSMKEGMRLGESVSLTAQQIQLLTK